jgi:type IV secretion system protein VirB10
MATEPAAASPPPAPSDAQENVAADPNQITIPAGTRIPLGLKQAISTKNAREGDPVYAETTFPFVMNDRVVVPAGTYIQGRITRVERAGRIKGRAEILMHFTSMIFPSGYTVMLPGSVQNTPGAEKTSVKDSEGTIRQDNDTGKKVEDAARNGAYGGAAAGIAWALLKRGNDVRLEVGTSIEMEIVRAITLDGTRSRRLAIVTR